MGATPQEQLTDVTTSAVDVARVVADLPSAELDQIVGGEAWPPILEEVVRRAPEFADPAAAADAPDVTLAFRIRGPRDATDHVRLAVNGGGVEVRRADDADAQVVLTVGRSDWVRLVTGNLNGGVAFLRGDLTFEGDELQALAVAGVFRVPSATGSDAADPLGIDVAEIVRVVGEVPDGELRGRLSGALREVVLDEIFNRFPEYLQADQARDVDALLKFVLTGRADGETDRYLVAIEHGACRVGRDLEGDPRVTIRIDAADFLKLVTGNLNPVMAFLRGRLRLKGDVALAANLPRIFHIPTAEDAH